MSVTLDQVLSLLDGYLADHRPWRRQAPLVLILHDGLGEFWGQRGKPIPLDGHPRYAFTHRQVKAMRARLSDAIMEEFNRG